MVTSIIIPIVYQAERDFPNLTMKGVVGTARGLDAMLLPVQVSLNQLFEDHWYWNVLYLQWLVGQTCWIQKRVLVFFKFSRPSQSLSRHHVPCQHPSRPLLRTSLIPLAASFWFHSPYQGIRNTKNRHKISQGDLSAFSTTGYKAFALLCSQMSLTTMVAKKSFCTELLPWQSSILHLLVKHQ